MSIKDVSEGKIIGIQFAVMSPEHIEAISKVKITARDTLETGSTIKKGGLLDQRMGVIERTAHCLTCRGKNLQCPGHFGHIDLEKPVFHIGFMQVIMDVLRLVCPHCSRFLISRNDKIYSKLLKITEPAVRIKAALKHVGKMTKCYYPNPIKGGVPEGCELLLASYHYAQNVRVVAEFPVVYPSFSDKTKFVLSPESVHRIFRRIKVEDYEMIFFDEENVRPQWLILTKLLVPPIPLRPTNMSNVVARTEDEKTRKLAEILNVSECLKKENITQNELSVYTQVLQMHVALYIDSRSVSSQQKFITRGNKKLKGWVQILSHKDGRFRGNLMGKRIDFSSRTVISPDPFRGLNEVGVPRMIAKKLTKTVFVNRYNKDQLTQLVINGPLNVDGADAIIDKDGSRIDLRTAKKEEILPLRIGTSVERHMINGDLVVFNRQPSLHKVSMMAHRAIIRKDAGNTFQFNPSPTTPYNADFDGDEMNLSLEQSQEAEAELEGLLLVEKNILSTQNGRPIMSLVQDSLLGARLLTMRDAFLTKSQIMQIIGFTFCWNGRLPIPAVLAPVPLWTGKQIASCIMPNINYDSYSLDFVEEEKNNMPDYFESNHDSDWSLKLEDLSPSDTKLIVRDGEILCGHFCKKTVGNSHNSLVHIVVKDFGCERNRHFIEDLQMITRNYFSYRGFTIGNGDMPVEKGIKKKVLDNLSIIEDHMKIWKKQKISKEEYETRTNKMLNDARGQVASDILKKLSINNNFGLILSAGSKGTKINLSQISVCGGQSNVEGKRIGDAFTDRVSIHVKKFDDRPIPKGFIYNCLMTGLTPMEMFNYSANGREGLIDTAVKTSETGYMQRRLCKAQEDLSIAYDGTVRNSQGNIIQFAWGDDAFDSCFMEFHRYDLYSMKPAVFQKYYFWEDSTHPLILLEKTRFENDYYLVELNRDVHATYTTPINFKRMLSNLKFKQDNVKNNGQFRTKTSLSPLKVITDVIDLQVLLWKSIPQIECPWDTKFAFLLRSMLSSKRIICEWNVSEQNWGWLMETIAKRFVQYLGQPGDMVGILGGQSIGEPSTQMTLNVFHFVGVSEKNIQLGVPRLKEIINHAKTTKTPSLTIFLKQPMKSNKELAESFSKSIIARFFSEIIISEEIIYDPLENVNENEILRSETTTVVEDCEIVKKFSLLPDFPDIKKGLEWSQYILRFEIDGEKLQEWGISLEQIVSILHRKYEDTIYLEYNNEFETTCILRLRPMDEKKNDPIPGEDFFLLREIIKQMKHILIGGYHGIEKSFVREDKEKKEFIVETEGTNLRQMLADPYVDNSRSFSNDISEIAEVLGMEAAFTSIIREINQVLSFYDIYVDYRHSSLLANLMCHREKIMGYTRHGMKKTDKGPLLKASFEETAEVLHDAARFAKIDYLKGVSEAIMIGSLAPIGTGRFSLFLDSEKVQEAYPNPPEPVEEKPVIIKTPRPQVFERLTTTMASLYNMESKVNDDLDNFLQQEYRGNPENNDDPAYKVFRAAQKEWNTKKRDVEFQYSETIMRDIVPEHDLSNSNLNWAPPSPKREREPMNIVDDEMF